MPPRIQSLNSLKGVLKPISIIPRVPFSTTASTSAERNLSQGELHKLITIDVSHDAASRRPIPSSRPSNKPARARASVEATNQALINVIGKATQKNNQRRAAANSPQVVQETVTALRDHQRGINLGKQIHRRWKAGDVYAPHDLTGAEMAKWKNRGKPGFDVFDVLDLNPLDQYKNFSILSEYVSSMGRIKPIAETGLRRVNQRRIARAIRRGVGMGIMPSVHRHPELLYNETSQMAQKGGNDVWRKMKNSMVF